MRNSTELIDIRHTLDSRTFGFCLTTLFLEIITGWASPQRPLRGLWGTVKQEFLQAVCPSCCPANSVKAVKVKR